LFTAATIARFDGMEILGFELDPDFAMTDGDYDLTDQDTNSNDVSPGQDQGADVKDSSEPKNQEPAQAKSDTSAADFASANEMKRAADSTARPNKRFHYRMIAVEHAMKAADLLPHSSQAFAAVLCAAAQWTIDREPETAEAAYSRYLKEGAYVPWGRDFGRSCPSPDFDAARTMWIRSEYLHIRAHARAHPRYSMTVGLFASVLLIMTVSLLTLKWIRLHKTPRLGGPAQPSSG
jgi:hypothetical protein